MGLLAAGSERPTEAARLLAAATIERERLGYVRFVPDQAEIDATMRRVETALGPSGLAAATSEGAGLSVDAAVAYARRGRGRRGRPRFGWAALTPTERMVTELVVDGLTNAERGAPVRLYRYREEPPQSHLRQTWRRKRTPTRRRAAVAQRHETTVGPQDLRTPTPQRPPRVGAAFVFARAGTNEARTVRRRSLQRRPHGPRARAGDRRTRHRSPTQTVVPARSVCPSCRTVRLQQAGRPHSSTAPDRALEANVEDVFAKVASCARENHGDGPGAGHHRRAESRAAAVKRGRCLDTFPLPLEHVHPAGVPGIAICAHNDRAKRGCDRQARRRHRQLCREPTSSAVWCQPRSYSVNTIHPARHLWHGHLRQQ